MNILNSMKYRHLLDAVCKNITDWSELEGKTFFVTGASGMIGSFLVDTIMYRNQQVSEERKIRVIAVSRSRKTAEERFCGWCGGNELTYISHDIVEPFGKELPVADYYIHAASTTHPLAYVNEPINTVLSNIFGIYNVLELAARDLNSKSVFLSSVEVYGENRGDVERFAEDYCGYLNCNTLRAGYPEAKRASEALCQAYIKQKGLDAVIVRLPRVYGPSMRMTDSKAVAQFIKKGVFNEDIVLKSEGNQLYSYAHVADAVSAVLFVLVHGSVGEAYNVGDERSDITLKDLAKMIARYADTEVVFELPDEKERQGYSTATTAIMNSKKINELGWHARYDIATGLKNTMEILKEIYC